MTDTTHSPEENLAFLRQLATAGKDAPLMAGPYLIAGGGWFGAASLIQWPPLRELLGLDFGQAVLAWLLAAVGFAIHLTVLIRRDRGKVENSANRTVNAAWTGVGYGIFAFWLGVAAMAYQRGDEFVMNTISLQVLSVYGIAWTIAAAATGHGWMKANAFFALLTVPVLGLFVGTGHEYLIYAIALVLTAVVPGVRLVRLAQQKQG
jgi:predicted Abi (CAAX) family protease